MHAGAGARGQSRERDMPNGALQERRAACVWGKKAAGTARGRREARSTQGSLESVGEGDNTWRVCVPLARGRRTQCNGERERGAGAARLMLKVGRCSEGAGTLSGRRTSLARSCFGRRRPALHPLPASQMSRPASVASSRGDLPAVGGSGERAGQSGKKSKGSCGPQQGLLGMPGRQAITHTSHQPD